MRWVRKNRVIYQDGRIKACRLCGSCYGVESDGKCRPTTCLACGSVQCMSNGLSNGTCSICYHGLLPGWSGNDQKCGYKGCEEKAVARAPRGKKFCCAKHFQRAHGHPVEEYLKDRSLFWVEVEDT